MPRTKKRNNDKLSRQDKRIGWPAVIAMTEEKIGRIDVKKAQL